MAHRKRRQFRAFCPPVPFPGRNVVHPRLPVTEADHEELVALVLVVGADRGPAQLQGGFHGRRRNRAVIRARTDIHHTIGADEEQAVRERLDEVELLQADFPHPASHPLERRGPGLPRGIPPFEAVFLEYPVDVVENHAPDDRALASLRGGEVQARKALRVLQCGPLEPCPIKFREQNIPGHFVNAAEVGECPGSRLGNRGPVPDLIIPVGRDADEASHEGHAGVLVVVHKPQRGHGAVCRDLEQGSRRGRVEQPTVALQRPQECPVQAGDLFQSGNRAQDVPGLSSRNHGLAVEVGDLRRVRGDHRRVLRGLSGELNQHIPAP